MKTIVAQPDVRTFALTLSGGAEVTIHRGDGRVERHAPSRNLVTTGGMNFLAQWVSSYGTGANSQMTHMVIGTSTVAASINQATCLGEVARRAFSSVSVSANSWTAVTTFGGGTDAIAGVTITEVAVFNAAGSGAGVMWNRVLLATSFTLQNSDVAAVRVWSAIGSR